MFLSVDNLPFLQDRSVEVIYNCHVLEHFKRRDVQRVLREWYRVLMPGGVLRIAVPDFAALCEVYNRTHDLGLVVGPIFGRQDYLCTTSITICSISNRCRYSWRRQATATCVGTTGAIPSTRAWMTFRRLTFRTWIRNAAF